MSELLWKSAQVERIEANHEDHIDEDAETEKENRHKNERVDMDQVEDQGAPEDIETRREREGQED